MGKSEQEKLQLTALRSALIFGGKGGKSAYAYAVDNGYTGTEAHFGRMMATLGTMRIVTLTGETVDGDVITYFIIGSDGTPTA